ITERDVEDFSNSAIGKNYFTLDTQELTDDIISSQPFIQNLIITKEFPKYLRLSILERDPFVLITSDSNDECVLVDAKSYVILIETEECEQALEKYPVPTLLVDEFRVAFKTNEQSSFYLVTDVVKISKVLESFGFATISIDYRDDVLAFVTNGDVKFVFSTNQPIEDQLTRMIAVMRQIQYESMPFT